jgi:FKBP-type peptidyl-prolyl cis-trans isomerase (trigger factor)
MRGRLLTLRANSGLQIIAKPGIVQRHMTDISHYPSHAVSPSDDSQVTITGEIPVTIVEQHRPKALSRLGRNVAIDGFRPGKVPPAVLAERLGEIAVWNEMASSAIAEAYPILIAHHQLRIVGNPHISITKLAPGNPVGFSITTGVMPEISLPDYRALATAAITESSDSLTVTEAEVTEAIESIRQNHAHAKWHREHPEDHSHDHPEFTEADLPVFDETFVQSLGGFKTIPEFTEALTKQIYSSKEQRQHEKQRAAIAESLIQATSFGVPPVFLEAELNKMTAEFESTVGRMGLSMSDYLSKIDKDIATLRTEWRAEAKKRAQLQLILNAIADKESVTLDEKAVAREVAHILEHYPDAREENVQGYVETMMTNQKVFELLEGERKKTPTSTTS